MGLGSGSKSFTATAMGLLMDDFAAGRNETGLPHGVPSFNWDTKVQDLLPDVWKLEDEWASEKASIHDIMSHVSGLPRQVPIRIWLVIKLTS
jgi:CubicO group peptidase (beta-lactamase class C family)